MKRALFTLHSTTYFNTKSAYIIVVRTLYRNGVLLGGLPEAVDQSEPWSNCASQTCTTMVRKILTMPKQATHTWNPNLAITLKPP
jgi:hypothetical protein